MIQVGTFLNIIDNSGAKIVSCIKIITGYRSRYSYIGNKILISIKQLRNKRRKTSKVKKGDIYSALILREKTYNKNFFGDQSCFLENSAVLLNKQNKLIGTRIFGSVSKKFRYTKFLKIIAVSSGITN